jgi:hypothetical protein
MMEANMSTQTQPITVNDQELCAQELRAFILTTDFEKAMEGLAQDKGFKRTVELGTETFIERYGKRFGAASTT